MIRRPPETLKDRLLGRIEQAWEAAGAWPEFTAAMRQSLHPQPPLAPVIAARRPPWLRLPLLCCQAAGGDPQMAEPAAAAWVLLYAAAHLLDSLQDGDPPEPWWQALGPGPAGNVATGLIATATLVLAAQPSADLLLQDFFRTILHMSSAQHLDLTAVSPSLEDAWRMAEAKSGAFFGLACRAGARAAGIDEGLVSHYSTYGVSLGLLVQIGDDLGDLAGVLRHEPGHGQLALLLAFARSIAQPDDPAPSDGGGGTPAVLESLQATGAALYLSTKAQEFRLRGAASLQQAALPSAARSELLQLLENTPSPR